ncbi:MAG: TIGR01244 family phosphatase [Caulobacteraceae bacterium]|nr:TIGR01244 family phosphatase [Caulobacteraceae bacterium]
MAPRPLSPTVWASPQLAPEALPALAAAGVARIISNRPDGEEPGQPTAAMMEAAAREAGMAFAWIPVSGLPGPDQVAAVAELLADGLPTVMFCRSGMRSASAWAMAQRRAGLDADALRDAAAEAGYDLGRVPL